MIEKKEDNIRSESYYPDSNYYLDQDNISQQTLLSEDQISKLGGKFEWPDSYWFIAERTNGRLAMIGFMAVIINYTLFGWIAYPILWKKLLDIYKALKTTKTWIINRYI